MNVGGIITRTSDWQTDEYITEIRSYLLRISRKKVSKRSTTTTTTNIYFESTLNIFYRGDLKNVCLLYQDVSHGFDMFVSIVWCVLSLVSTCVRVIRISSRTKPDSGITRVTPIMLVGNDTDSCFGMRMARASGIESLFVTVGLQRGFRTNQRFPRVTTQWRGAVVSISDQWIQRAGPSCVDGNEPNLLIILHTKTCLVEGSVPVSR